MKHSSSPFEASNVTSCRVRTAWRRLVLTAAFALATACTAEAATGPVGPVAHELAAPTLDELRSGALPCTPAHAAAVEERRRRIENAPTVEEARKLALGPAAAARRAVQLAAFVSPSHEGLVDARARLDVYSTRVEQSRTPSQVADEFERLLQVDPNNGGYLQLADVQIRHANVRGPGRCFYTTGEIVAIVFGFILFIIPGIILLFLLC